MSPDNFSAHEELARWRSSATSSRWPPSIIENAWRLRPDRRGLLLDLGRVWQAGNRPAEAMSALLAASRGASRGWREGSRAAAGAISVRVRVRARAGARSANVELRRELAYLHLEMKNRGPRPRRRFERWWRGAGRSAVDGATRVAASGARRFRGRDAAAASRY